MVTPPEVKHKENAHDGEFQLWSGGEMLAHMMYSKPFSDRIIIQHTEVKRSEHGKGYGKKLVESMVAFARAHQLMVVPLRQYTRGVFEKHPEYQDLL